MLHLYFFVSSKKEDNVSCITVLSRSAKQAFALACRQFIRCNYIGIPQRLAI